MRFMMLVKATKDYEAGVLPDEKMLSEMAKYNEELVKAGALLAVDRLQASSKGARVRYAKGKFTVIDGPFAETKELIAGFWLIEAKSRDEAIEWAKRVPFQEGEVEVRPLFELTDFPVDPAEKPDGWRDKEEQFRAAPPAAEARNDPVHGHPQGRQGHGGGRPPGRKIPVRDGSVHGGRGEGRAYSSRAKGSSPARRGRGSGTPEASAW